MRPAAVIIALAALSATSAYQLELGDYWSKLGAVTWMESCLGKNTTGEYVKLLVKTLYDCNNVSSEADSEQTISSLETANWDKIFNEYSPRFYRQNEFAPDNTARIAHVKNRIAHLIKRFRCVHQRVGVTDSNNQIMKDAIEEDYKVIGLSPTLLADLLAGVDQCYKLTQCLPLDHINDTPIPKDVVQVQTFLNCERYLRNWACLKNFLGDWVAAGEYDFSGADGTLDFLPDDQARAAAIDMALQLVGGDDYGLFE